MIRNKELQKIADSLIYPINPNYAILSKKHSRDEIDKINDELLNEFVKVFCESLYEALKIIYQDHIGDVMTSELKEIMEMQAYYIIEKYLQKWGKYLTSNRIKTYGEITFGKDEFFESRNEDPIILNYDNHGITISFGRLLNDIIKKLPGGQL